jgi:septum formation protein
MMREPLILASKSPRRRALLAALGLTFTIDAAEVDETPLPGEAPCDMVVRLSRLKALTVAARRLGETSAEPGSRPTRSGVILASDTIVVLDDRLLGKPSDAAEAGMMLRTLRGRAHTVYTALALAQGGEVHTRLTASQVFMRDYSDAEISAYIATGDPLDKAGAYAIQHPSFSPVADWQGCYTGIMGLPLGVVAELLASAGIGAPVDVAATCAGLAGRCCLQGK